MQKCRRHERTHLLADVTIEPGEVRPTRFAAKMFNVSRSGAALFSVIYFPPGKIAGMEIVLPLADEGMRRVTLYGVVRRVQVQPDGNILGIEFITETQAGDYAWFVQYLDDLPSRALPSQKGGFTLVETCITMTIICLLVTMATPIYLRAIEQARVDMAGSNLRMIWTAQRVYWLEYRTFSSSLATLDSLDLVDHCLAQTQSSPTAVFVYQITGAGADSFTARALRNASTAWTGQLNVDETGGVTGAISGPNAQVLTPPS